MTEPLNAEEIEALRGALDRGGAPGGWDAHKWFRRLLATLDRDRAEAAASVRAALGEIIRTWDAAMVALIVTNDHEPIPEFLPVADAIKAARAILDATTPTPGVPSPRDPAPDVPPA